MSQSVETTIVFLEDKQQKFRVCMEIDTEQTVTFQEIICHIVAVMTQNQIEDKAALAKVSRALFSEKHSKQIYKNLECSDSISVTERLSTDEIAQKKNSDSGYESVHYYRFSELQLRLIKNRFTEGLPENSEPEQQREEIKDLKPHEEEENPNKPLLSNNSIEIKDRQSPLKSSSKIILEPIEASRISSNKKVEMQNQPLRYNLQEIQELEIQDRKMAPKSAADSDGCCQLI